MFTRSQKELAIGLALCVLMGLLFLRCIPAHAQVACFQSGNVTSCIGPRSGQDTVQTDLGHGQGVITDSQGNMMPYSVSPAPRSRSSQPATAQPYSYGAQSQATQGILEMPQPYDPGSILLMPGFGAGQ